MLMGLHKFASRLRAVLSERLGRRTEVLAADFAKDLHANAALLEHTVALVAVHGAALTNLVLAPPGLRAVLQLVPDCLPAQTYSHHAYEVLASLATSGRARSLCCACISPELGKNANVTCTATRAALGTNRRLPGHATGST